MKCEEWMMGKLIEKGNQNLDERVSSSDLEKCSSPVDALQ